MPREMEPFVIAVVLVLTAAWAAALGVILRAGERGQRVWTWCFSLAVIGAALGFSALIVLDAVRPPRTITGTVQSMGDAGDAGNDASYTVVVNGRTYALRRADLQKLQVGERIRAEAGAVFNFLQRVEPLP
jgi:hypothetical protein